jgi:hypothetical protein
MTGVDPIPDQAVQPPEGVLVVRSVAGVSGGRRAFRITCGSESDHEPTVKVVSEVRALHEVIDDWVSSLGS